MDKKQLEKYFSCMKKYGQVIHIMAQIQMHLHPFCQKKAQLLEIQVNWVTIMEKLD
jgi:hypothetical protein